MSDLSNRLAMRERMLHEGNVRLNRENAALLKRGPDAWEAFKEAFRAECEAINAETSLTRLKCEKSGLNLFDVTRIPLNSPQVGALSFRFDPVLPRIVFMDLRNNKPQQSLEMALEGHDVHFLRSGKAMILSRFIEECLDAIWP